MTHPTISTKTATLALLRLLIASFVVQATNYFPYQTQATLGEEGLALRSHTLLSIIP
jgi:hypothetical protein